MIFHKKENTIIGRTHLREMVKRHKSLEVGSTWLHPGYWKTRINPECKLLLLQFCFETLDTMHVMLRPTIKIFAHERQLRK